MPGARIILLVTEVGSLEAKTWFANLRRRYPRKAVRRVVAVETPSSYAKRGVWLFATLSVIEKYPDDRNWVIAEDDRPIGAARNPNDPPQPVLYLCVFTPRSRRFLRSPRPSSGWDTTCPASRMRLGSHG